MKKILGGVLLAVGILLAGASGLCSLVVLFNSPDILTGLGGVLVFAGPFIVAGAGLAFAGRWLIRRAREEEGQH